MNWILATAVAIALFATKQVRTTLSSGRLRQTGFCHRAWPFVFEACSLNHAFILLKDLKVLRNSG